MLVLVVSRVRRRGIAYSFRGCDEPQRFQDAVGFVREISWTRSNKSWGCYKANLMQAQEALVVVSGLRLFEEAGGALSGKARTGGWSVVRRRGGVARLWLSVFAKLGTRAVLFLVTTCHDVHV